MKVDLDELERQYSPFKQVPVVFVEYPQVNKLCAAVPHLIEELRAARKAIEKISGCYDSIYAYEEIKPILDEYYKDVEK